MMNATREEAWKLLQQHVSNESLLKHCLAVEIAMRAYAEMFSEDQEYWGTVGLLHDIDFEKYPDQHPYQAGGLLAPHGFDVEFIANVESHDRNWPGERTLLQKALLAVDELTGFIIACALVRPDKSLEKLEVKSVMKKMKDKAFARAVNRETIITSADALGVELKEHIAYVAKALAAAVQKPKYQKLA